MYYIVNWRTGAARASLSLMPESGTELKPTPRPGLGLSFYFWFRSEHIATFHAVNSVSISVTNFQSSLPIRYQNQRSLPKWPL